MKLQIAAVALCACTSLAHAQAAPATLIAPRPLLLQTGNTDNWSDPKGEFLAAVAAGPVYQLLGKEDLGADVWPAAKTPIFHDLNYYMHDGGHGMVPGDWDIYVEFLKMHLHPEQ